MSLFRSVAKFSKSIPPGNDSPGQFSASHQRLSRPASTCRRAHAVLRRQHLHRQRWPHPRLRSEPGKRGPRVLPPHQPIARRRQEESPNPSPTRVVHRPADGRTDGNTVVAAPCPHPLPPGRTIGTIADVSGNAIDDGSRLATLDRRTCCYRYDRQPSRARPEPHAGSIRSLSGRHNM